MSFCEDIRIYPQRHACFFAQAGGPLRQQLQFLLALYVEQQNAGAKRQVHLLCRFSDAGEYGPRNRALVRSAYALQFPAGNDVKARTFPCDHS